MAELAAPASAPKKRWRGSKSSAPGHAAKPTQDKQPRQPGRLSTGLAGLRADAERQWHDLEARARNDWGPRLQPIIERSEPWRRRLAAPRHFIGVNGWVALVAFVLALVLGLTQGWVELTVLAVILGLCLLAAFALVLGRTDYGVRIELDSNRVKVGQEAWGRLLVTNRSRRSLLPTRIELPVSKAVAAFELPAMGHEDEHEELFRVPTRRRGVIPIGPVASVRTDPLHLMRRSQRWTEMVELFVHPRTVILDAGSAGFLKDVEGVTTQQLSSNDVSFHALREYVPGDDRRAIHWRTTARTGRFMVRQFEETRRTHLLLLLSVNAADYASPDDFEVAVSCAGSLGLQALREEREVSLVTQTGRIHFPSGPGLLDELSRVELREHIDSVAKLAEHGLAAVPAASVVGLVCGSVPTPRDLRGADLLVPLDVSRFCVRTCTEHQPARRSIGQLTVLEVASVDELPRAVRTLR